MTLSVPRGVGYSRNAPSVINGIHTFLLEYIEHTYESPQ